MGLDINTKKKEVETDKGRVHVAECRTSFTDGLAELMSRRFPFWHVGGS